MATIGRVETPGAHTLEAFQEVVQQQEGIFGPLVSLGSLRDVNVMTFEVSLSPAHRAVLATYVDHPAPIPGHTLICAGPCLVEGAREQVAAYRRKE